MKAAMKIILLLGVTGYLIFAVIYFHAPTEERVCTAVDVQVTDTVEGELVTPQYVLRLLSQHKLFPEGQRISEISLEQIEKTLNADPCIAKASCYINNGGVLRMHIKPEHPILYIVSPKGGSYYLDGNGRHMPVDEINVDLPIVTGEFSDKFAEEQLIPLAKFIAEQPFWKRQVEQIHVVNEHHVEIFPQVGKHKIMLGELANFRDKLNRLKFFYEHGLPKVGWNKYKTIDLEYDGQIVCTKY